MRKWLFIVILILLLHLSGCGANDNEFKESVFWWYYSGAATEDGYFFVDNEYMLHFFDYQSGKTVYVCNKPECPHKPAELLDPASFKCEAQLPTNQFAVFNGGIYYFYNVAYNTLELRRRDLDGNNDRGLRRFKGQDISEALFYRNSVILTKVIYSSETFDPATGNEDAFEFVLSVIDLTNHDETVCAKVIADASGIVGPRNAIVLHDVADGKISYYDESLAGYYEYDIASGKVTRNEDILVEQNPVNSPYAFAYKDYVYGIDNSDVTQHMLRKSLINSTEELILSTDKRVLFDNYHTDNVLIMLATNESRIKSADNELYIYNTVTGELKETKHPVIKTPAFVYPIFVTNDGIFVKLAVDNEDESIGYDGTYETVYITFDELISDRGTYISVYTFFQEPSGTFSIIE